MKTTIRRGISMKKKIDNNILAVRYPKLAKEWHPTKNGELSPYDVTYGSQKKVWWTCTKGHEWEARIFSRSKGSGCPDCFSEQRKKEHNALSPIQGCYVLKNLNYSKGTESFKFKRVIGTGSNFCNIHLPFFGLFTYIKGTTQASFDPFSTLVCNTMYLKPLKSKQSPLSIFIILVIPLMLS